MKKVAELEGAELDYWVARALGWEHLGAIGVNYENKEKPYCLSSRNDWWRHQEHQPYPMCGPCHGFPYPFSTDWSQGGPIIERYGIDLKFAGVRIGWFAHFLKGTGPERHAANGPTPIIAAMRCFVASKFGDEVGEDV